MHVGEKLQPQTTPRAGRPQGCCTFVPIIRRGFDFGEQVPVSGTDQNSLPE